jgi:HK97 family phage portal protein
MQVSAVYACVRVLSETIASLPLLLYRRLERGKEKATYHPLYFLLHDMPNPDMTSFTFRETLMSHLLLWGNAYAQGIRDELWKAFHNSSAITRSYFSNLFSNALKIF